MDNLFNLFDIEVGDLDGDRDLDVVVVGLTTAQPEGFVQVLLNDGMGNLGFGDTYWLDFLVVGSELADMDGDRDDDLIAVGSISFQILENDGDATFKETEPISIGNMVHPVHAEDFDNDNDIDVVFGVRDLIQSVDILVFENDGGLLLPTEMYNVNGKVFDIKSGDLDGDSDLDIVTPNEDDNSVSILTNKGQNEFLQAVSFPVGQKPLSVAVADLDGDLDLDIVAANCGSGDISILLNEQILQGDVNLDGVVNLFDTPFFVDLLIAGDYQAQADMNCDGNVNLLDVDPFVELLTGG